MKAKIEKVFLLVLFLMTILLSKPDYNIKMGTVAPENSFWIEELNRVEQKIQDSTNGKIGFQIYPSGIQGDEVQMLRKMKLGQLDAASFTGVGLGRIVPDIRVFELPFLFKSYEEIDYIKKKLFDYFQKRFWKKGYYLASWGEVGFVYLFTKKKVRNVRDLRKLKIWLWKGDPLAKTVFNVLDIPAVSLPINDVFTSLQTGLIEGAYISPYGSMAMQWYTKTDYIMKYPLTYSIGAVLINKDKFESIPKKHRKILIRETKQGMSKITQKSRQDNQKSLKLLQENGLELIEVSEKAKSKYKQAGEKTRRKLSGDLYSQEILDRVLNLLEEYRNKNQKQ